MHWLEDHQGWPIVISPAARRYNDPAFPKIRLITIFIITITELYYSFRSVYLADHRLQFL